MDDKGRIFERLGRIACVNLWYPRIDGDDDRGDIVDEIRVGLCDVRAADDISISYDFERDGYVIKQMSNFGSGDPDWQEVAFVQAWQREIETEEQS